MSNRSKGPRLVPKGKGDNPILIIRDGNERVATGCRASDREEAEQKLAEYITAKHKPALEERRIDKIPLADVISIYLTEVVEKKPPAQAKRAAARAVRLIEFFGNKTLNKITGKLCRAYEAQRGTAGGARRDLQDLSAAIQHHHKEGYHVEEVRVALPKPGTRRHRWLTRSEIARLVWAAWSFKSAMPIPGQYQDGALPPGIRRPAKHVARAILFGYYTGSRPGDVLRASFISGIGRSFIDLDNGVFYRLPPGKVETNKKQPPCRLGNRLMAHLRRWRGMETASSYVVEYDGGPVLSIKTSMAAAIKRAKLEGPISPYTLRHSRITHQLQKSVDMWEIAGNVGTSEKMIRDNYGHHDPRTQSKAANV